MIDAFKALNNIRTLRAQAREVELEALEELLEKLSIVVEERREEDTISRKAQEEHQAKLEAFRQKLQEDGIDPAELLAGINTTAQKKTKTTRTPRPAKYTYTDTDGSTKTWTGQGRTPKAIADALASGKKLEEFEI